MEQNAKQIMPSRTNFKEGEVVDSLSLDMSDEEIKALVSQRKNISKKLTEIVKDNWGKSLKYYTGKDDKVEMYLKEQSKVYDNRLFTDLETLVPLVTARPAKPIATIPYDNTDEASEQAEEQIKEQASKIQRILLALYNDNKLQEKFQRVVRHNQLCRIGVLKYGIGKDDKIFARVILPTRIKFDSEATTIEDSEFIGEDVVTTVGQLIKMFPEKEKEILHGEGFAGMVKSAVGYGENKGKKITYTEWWSDEYRVIEYKGIILEKIKNPLYIYDNTDEEYDESDETENPQTEEKKPTQKLNYFESPKKPYIFFNVYNLGESILDDTTPFELGKSLQDDINIGKRQISDNADKVGNPIRVYRGLTKEQGDEADYKLGAGDGVTLEEGQSIEYIQAVALPQQVYQRVTDSRDATDNIFGIHSTTRGERAGDETARGHELMRAGDEDRQSTIGRAVEVMSEELYKAFLHLIKAFYDEDQTASIIGRANAQEMVRFNRDDIADGVQIQVQPGSTVPDDKIARMTQAMELAKNGKITDERLFETLGYENPKEIADELKQQQMEIAQASQPVVADPLMTQAKEAIANLQ